MSQLQLHDSFEPYFAGRETALTAKRQAKLANEAKAEERASLRREAEPNSESAEQRH